MAAPHPSPLPANGARGRAIREVAGNGEVAAWSLRPVYGERWRQPDEGRPLEPGGKRADFVTSLKRVAWRCA
ncbi:hypothetical protein ELH42_06740 [Rhizobium ruizarguesonis]|nr:hypothetical protein ELH61_07245 [Rhizobium ruizarguesonis]TBA47379.1 hypothetical protein ELH63_07005 [Rhizobium ruizarguesonis]TBA63458.1 hypothetical protein ELH57_07020 [Rhizobium ruizarguesonis]TBB65880.1 hypothetical protein ELH42_06740 [Rhizobium ruizarguesonis]TBB70268.1 hypothetical protein ELH45_06790 [Rhizobium ruizarguesonis]